MENNEAEKGGAVGVEHVAPVGIARYLYETEIVRPGTPRHH